MDYLDYYFLGYVVYLPVFFLGIVVLVLSEKGYSVRTHTVSELALLRRPKNVIFNILTFLYGFLGISSVVVFAGQGELSVYRAVCSGVLFLVCVGTMLVAVFPLNVSSRRHYWATLMLFCPVIIAEMLLSGAFILDDRYLTLSLASVFLLALSVLLVVRARRYILAGGKHRGGEEHALAEWVVVVGMLVWNELFVITLLMG